ncbi:hypothetical protein SAY86_007544 [Trapa natans]|uniref:BSD domain-containing protein n=1 Tax=Trapa natans TaxID=22666 RepID=A0AAN7R0G4_TRANT|nr:hypothetical protein SAY86_007544 [Trapa natans]
MSWLTRTIANSFRLDDDVSPYKGNPNRSSPHKAMSDDSLADSSASPPGQWPRGVKEDLTELKMTLKRQFWGIASFLAPREGSAPPSSESTPRPDRSPKHWDSADREASDDVALIAGIRRDLAEIGSIFKSGISKLSRNMTVREFTKSASNFLQVGAESESVDTGLIVNAVGVTEEALAFARNIAMHPQTWRGFPLPNSDDNSDGFELTDAQQEHALAIQQLAPRLGALRIELCPGYMSEASFWKVYFVLLHPRLSKHDAELLSTPQIVEAREMLMLGLQGQNKPRLESDPSAAGASMAETTDPSREEHLSGASSSAISKSVYSQPSLKDAPKSTASSVAVMGMHSIQDNEIQIMEKSAVDEEPSRQTPYWHSHPGFSSRAFYNKYEDDSHHWLKEGTVEIFEVRGTTSILIENDEDVSFSDIEEDDASAGCKIAAYSSDSSSKDLMDWVQLEVSSYDSGKESEDAKHSGRPTAHEIEIKESNDWLDIADIHKV